MSDKTDQAWQSTVWRTQDGGVLSCVEKLKVLNDNFAELEQLCQDAFEDALLMGCEERQIREALVQVISGLKNPYTRD
ncbi:MAG: hypothetical protein JO128_12445 [Alphaproteobacteria bacterium]|nr:hypothetical protein [Alphaproteobacteria bacterium]